jgi:hypothetical protein
MSASIIPCSRRLIQRRAPSASCDLVREAGRNLQNLATTYLVTVLLFAHLSEHMEEGVHPHCPPVETKPPKLFEDGSVDERLGVAIVLRGGRPGVYAAQEELLPLPVLVLAAVTHPAELRDFLIPCSARPRVPRQRLRSPFK